MNILDTDRRELKLDDETVRAAIALAGAGVLHPKGNFQLFEKMGQDLLEARAALKRIRDYDESETGYSNMVPDDEAMRVIARRALETK